MNLILLLNLYMLSFRSLRPYRCWAPCKSTFASAAALGVHQIKCRHNPALRRTNISTPLTRFLRPSVPVPQNLTPLPSPTAGNRVVTACATSTTPITYQILSPPPTPPSPEVNDGADNTRYGSCHYIIVVYVHAKLIMFFIKDHRFEEKVERWWRRHRIIW